MPVSKFAFQVHNLQRYTAVRRRATGDHAHRAQHHGGAGPRRFQAIYGCPRVQAVGAHAFKLWVPTLSSYGCPRFQAMGAHTFKLWVPTLSSYTLHDVTLHAAPFDVYRAGRAYDVILQSAKSPCNLMTASVTTIRHPAVTALRHDALWGARSGGPVLQSATWGLYKLSSVC
jgi:hypothetical protein